MSTTKPSHEPSPDELEHASADGGLHHPGDLAGEAHGPDDHGETDGPVDVRAWGALALGVGAGLLIVLCLVITTRLLAATPV